MYGNPFIDFVTNEICIATFFGWLFAQTIKVIIETIRHRKFSVEYAVAEGGMPSCHASTVCSMTASLFWSVGPASPVTALGLVFAFVAMRDAMGVRYQSGIMAGVVKDLTIFAKKKGADGERLENAESLNEKGGHTPLEIFVGMFIGIGVATAVHFIYIVAKAALVG